MATTFTVYFRTGGTDNFKWNKAVPVATEKEAIAMRAEVERMGYPAHYAKTAALDVGIGLPDTFAPEGE